MKRNASPTRPQRPTKWSDADRRAFADGNRLRATTIPNRKRQASKDGCKRGHWT